MEKTLLVIYPGRDIVKDCGFSILVAETGESLASHLCSHWGYAYNDLYGTREERKKKWTERFGELEVKFLEDTDITIEELLKRNKQWFESLPKKVEESEAVKSE